MGLHSRISSKMHEGFLGGLFVGMGIALISDFLLYEFEFALSYLALGLFMVSVGVAVYVYWRRKISSITYDADAELRKKWNN